MSWGNDDWLSWVQQNPPPNDAARAAAAYADWVYQQHPYATPQTWLSAYEYAVTHPGVAPDTGPHARAIGAAHEATSTWPWQIPSAQDQQRLWEDLYNDEVAHLSAAPTPPSYGIQVDPNAGAASAPWVQQTWGVQVLPAPPPGPWGLGQDWTPPPQGTLNPWGVGPVGAPIAPSNGAPVPMPPAPRFTGNAAGAGAFSPWPYPQMPEPTPAPEPPPWPFNLFWNPPPPTRR